MGQWDFWKLEQWDKGPMAQCDIGQWDNEQVNNEHVDSGQCHNGHRDNGTNRTVGQSIMG
jgi:hypothetical protein